MSEIKNTTLNASAFKTINPNDIRAPFGNYVHGLEIPSGFSLIHTSGQLGVSKEDATPEGISEQCEICFSNIRSILESFDATLADIIKVSGFLTDRTYFKPYMQVRDKYVQQSVCSTLLIVSGFTRPEFKVEVEIIAAVKRN